MIFAAITLSFAQIIVGCACIFAGGLLTGLHCLRELASEDNAGAEDSARLDEMEAHILKKDIIEFCRFSDDGRVFVNGRNFNAGKGTTIRAAWDEYKKR